MSPFVRSTVLISRAPFDAERNWTRVTPRPTSHLESITDMIDTLVPERILQVSCLRTMLGSVPPSPTKTLHDSIVLTSSIESHHLHLL